jgi:hypothetical protein
MPDPPHATPIVDKLWIAMDALLDAADMVPAGTPLERSLEAAIRTCGRAIIPAKEAAMLEQMTRHREGAASSH